MNNPGLRKDRDCFVAFLLAKINRQMQKIPNEIPNPKIPERDLVKRSVMKRSMESTTYGDLVIPAEAGIQLDV